MGSRMHRGVSSYGLIVVFVFLCFVLLIGATFAYPREADAQSSVVGASLLAQAPNVQQWGCPPEPRGTEHGGSLCASDWLAKTPIVLVAVAIVVGADAYTIWYVLRKRRREQATRTATSP